jgi:hypothetical protein
VIYKYKGFLNTIYRMINYIIGGIGVWALTKYGQIMIADYMVNHPFMTTRFQANLNQFKTD